MRATFILSTTAVFLLALAVSSFAEEQPSQDEAPYVLLSETELQDLVAPIALYPDDLLAIVLPASTYPLQIVQAARFVEDRASTDKPDETWDDTVVALTNYPEALQLLNDDLDWTWQLGEAVLYQEEEVLQAVSSYRSLAQDAGNLKSDEHQVVKVEKERIIIEPARERVVYVPYYDPWEVTHVHTRRVVHYYPTAYPLYYYPYSIGYTFPSDYFWGVTTWFSIGWDRFRLHGLHQGFQHHPYYRYNYRHHHYRNPRPSPRHRWTQATPRYHDGNHWRPNHRRHGVRPGTRLQRDRYNGPSRRLAERMRRADAPRHRSTRQQHLERRQDRPRVHRSYADERRAERQQRRTAQRAHMPRERFTRERNTRQKIHRENRPQVRPDRQGRRQISTTERAQPRHRPGPRRERAQPQARQGLKPRNQRPAQIASSNRSPAQNRPQNRPQRRSDAPRADASPRRAAVAPPKRVRNERQNRRNQHPRAVR